MSHHGCGVDNSPPLPILPKEIWFIILSTPGGVGLGAFACTCKQFSRLCADEEFWQYLCSAHFGVEGAIDFPRNGCATWKSHYEVLSRSATYVVLLGHVDVGKSTLVGHMANLIGDYGDHSPCYALRGCSFDRITRYAMDNGLSSFRYAFMMDLTRCERERGITMSSRPLFLRTRSNKTICLIDTPGHADFILNTARGVAMGDDVALVVVAAREGEFEAGLSSYGSLRSHLAYARSQGINKLILAINKCEKAYGSDEDMPSTRYTEVIEEVHRLTERYGYLKDQIRTIPISSWKGWNLATNEDRPKRFNKYYSGPPLAKLLQSTFARSSPSMSTSDPLRMLICRVHSMRFKMPLNGQRERDVAICKVKSGVVRVGQRISFGPSPMVRRWSHQVLSPEMIEAQKDVLVSHATVSSIQLGGVSRSFARAGDLVGISFCSFDVREPPSDDAIRERCIPAFYRGTWCTTPAHEHTIRPARYIKCAIIVFPGIKLRVGSRPFCIYNGMGMAMEVMDIQRNAKGGSSAEVKSVPMLCAHKHMMKKLDVTIGLRPMKMTCIVDGDGLVIWENRKHRAVMRVERVETY